MRFTNDQTQDEDHIRINIKTIEEFKDDEVLSTNNNRLGGSRYTSVQTRVQYVKLVDTQERSYVSSFGL